MQETNFPEKIKRLGERGIKCRDIAEAAGCAVSSVYRVRDGLIANPSYQIGKTIDRLLEEAGQESQT